MNADVEKLGPELVEVARRLAEAPQAVAGDGFVQRVMAAVGRDAEAEAARLPVLRRHGFLPWRRAYAAAAAIAALLGAAAVFTQDILRQAPEGSGPAAIALAGPAAPASAFAPYMQAYALKALAENPRTPARAMADAVRELLRSQGADGGWGSPAVTARNTAALAIALRAGEASAAIPWKRGRRFLRLHGIPETDPFAADARRLARNP